MRPTFLMMTGILLAVTTYALHVEKKKDVLCWVDRKAPDFVEYSKARARVPLVKSRVLLVKRGSPEELGLKTFGF